MSKKKPVKTRNEPLIPRPGARYTCFGDGLCCTDIHGIGPLTDDELVQIQRFNEDAADWDEEHEENMMQTAADGGCFFLMPDQRCAIHAEHGPEHKPEGCRRFPLGLVATPDGGRITTDHRCPCRTMGDRPEIQPRDVVASLRDNDGDLEDDRSIRYIRLKKKERITFEEWKPIEAELLDRLAQGATPEDVLDARPFPELPEGSWREQAHEFIDARDGTQFGVAMAWMGDAILQITEESPERFPRRPWSAAFDRAEARSNGGGSAEAIFADWIADEIWSLKWAEDHDWLTARQELVTRVAIGRHIYKHLLELGLREDRAAAESVMILEVVGESDYWGEVRDLIRG